jgi:hypothetical protein
MKPAQLEESFRLSNDEKNFPVISTGKEMIADPNLSTRT